MTKKELELAHEPSQLTMNLQLRVEDRIRDAQAIHARLGELLAEDHADWLRRQDERRRALR